MDSFHPGLLRTGNHIMGQKNAVAGRTGFSSGRTPIPFSSTNVNKSSLLWGYSSAGRASALQAEGQRFDPVYLHHLSFSFFPEILDQTFKKNKQILTCCSIETKFFANFRVAIVIIAIIEN